VPSAFYDSNYQELSILYFVFCISINVAFMLCYIYFKINIIIDIYDIYFDCVSIISVKIKKTL